ncbi:hypothetical protein [Rhizobium sp. 11515TR]|uniref:hypothetical protein n=1 Tax=Rhizobium sp. 11515TR TaxID=2028343 RepID=UPI000BA8C1FD|nr:hypothetical protein [Rhizobium sp. 11515TR]ASW07747.1 hypothetical protein CKA34_18775 [Rhizobium sp. 11515TR]
MVPLTFDARGYRFEKGLEILRAGFNGARDGALEKNDRLQAKLAQYQDALKNGEQPVGENDDDGHYLWDLETLLVMDLEEAAEAVLELRKAFVLAIYHFWERTIRSYCNTHEFGHNSLVKKAVRSGIAVDKNSLQKIQHLANVLKHNTSDLGRALRESWPDIFPKGFEPNGKTDWYSAVALTDEDVNFAFEAISNSGPRSRPSVNKPSQPSENQATEKIEMVSKPMRHEILDLDMQDPAFRKSAKEIAAVAMLQGLNWSFVGGTKRFLKLSGEPEQNGAFAEVDVYMKSVPYESDQKPDSEPDI